MKKMEIAHYGMARPVDAANCGAAQDEGHRDNRLALFLFLFYWVPCPLGNWDLVVAPRRVSLAVRVGVAVCRALKESWPGLATDSVDCYRAMRLPNDCSDRHPIIRLRINSVLP